MLFFCFLFFFTFCFVVENSLAAHLMPEDVATVVCACGSTVQHSPRPGQQGALFLFYEVQVGGLLLYLSCHFLVRQQAPLSRHRRKRMMPADTNAAKTTVEPTACCPRTNSWFNAVVE